MAGTKPSAPPPKRKLGRRRRRLYWTVATLLVVVVVGTSLGVAIHRRNRPDVYLPGEEHAEITRALARALPADAPEPRFTDVTAEAGLGSFRSFAGNRTSQLPEDMGPGAAWGDFDGDGDDDLFAVSAGGALNIAPGERARSRLYENRGDGTFAEVTGFPETRIIGMGAAWGDFDGDGRLDLVVTGYNALRLFHNRGGRLVPDPAIDDRDGYWSGASWSDFDLDGDLDLYVCGYVQYVADDRGQEQTSKQYGRNVPYTLNPASYRPASNLLFRNNGDGSFDEVAELLGVANPEGRSLAALWHDLNDDGWPELYVANDISDNALYLNDGGRFEEISHAAWVADYRGAMGLAAGDWNRDGDDDLFVTHWVAQENALYDSLLRNPRPDSDPDAGPRLQFVDVADQQGLGQIALRRVGWGAEFADFDGDGWLDLAISNGSTFEEPGEPRVLTPEPAFLLWNQQGRHFHDMAPQVESLAAPAVSRGLALSDYDQDGDVDLLFVHGGGGLLLLRNEMQTGHWIELRLRSRLAARADAYGFADGARVVAHVGDVALRRTVSSASYLSQSSRIVHIGLGDADQVDAVEVHWPGGAVETHADLRADTAWEIREGEAAPIEIVRPGRKLDREELREFWRRQRAAMRTMKVDRDLHAAIGLFREALALNPTHGDSLYYLGNCLAETGEVEAALDHFAEMSIHDPQSHRALKRWGTLRALTAESPEQMERAAGKLEQAVALNPEATGALLVLAEIDLVRGADASARQRLEWVCRTNPGAADALFLRAYIAWKSGDAAAAVELLQTASADHEEWKPEGGVAEGEVLKVMHSDSGLLGRFFESWDGAPEPASAFAALDAFLVDDRQRRFRE